MLLGKLQSAQETARQITICLKTRAIYNLPRQIANRSGWQFARNIYRVVQTTRISRLFWKR